MWGGKRMPVDEAVRLLAQAPLFAGIDEAHLRLLAYAAHEERIPGGRWLVRQGEDEPAGFLILSGAASAWLEENPANRLRIERGAFIGEGAMIAGLPHRMNVRAEKDMEVLRIPREEFLRVTREFPEMGRLILANYARRMAEVLSTLQSLLP